jgi:hypothetical protein
MLGVCKYCQNGQTCWKILSSKFILNQVQHRFQHLFEPNIVMLEKVAHGAGVKDFYSASVSAYVTKSFWAVIPTTEESRFSLISCREKMSPLST